MKAPPGELGAGWLDLICSRRSIRRYTTERVHPSVVVQLMRAAGWAPSAHNRQPWRFVLIEGDSLKHRLADGMGRKLREDRLADGDDPLVVARDVDRSYARLTGAPLLVVV